MYFKGSVFVFMLCNFIENSAQLCKRYSDVFLISHFLLCPSILLFLYYHKIPIKLPCKRPPSIFGEFGIFVHDRASAPSHFLPFQKLFFFLAFGCHSVQSWCWIQSNPSRCCYERALLALPAIAAISPGVVVFVRNAFLHGKKEDRSSGLASEKWQKLAPRFSRVQVGP